MLSSRNTESYQRSLSLRNPTNPYYPDLQRNKPEGWSWVQIMNALAISSVALRYLPSLGNPSAVSQVDWTLVGSVVGPFLGSFFGQVAGSAATNATNNAVNIATKQIMDQQALNSVDSKYLTDLFLGDCEGFHKKDSAEAVRKLMVRDPANPSLAAIREGYIKCRDKATPKK